jgi:hypothetical protein
MSRSTNRTGPRRNTAPLWKKLAVVLAAPLAALFVIRVLNATEWPFFVFVVVVAGVAAVAVWGMARLLGVHLSLGSWD